jgi:hypothetical protein
MAFDFFPCRSVLLDGIVDALAFRASSIGAIKRVPNVEFPISGMALDMAPWHGGLGLSLRMVSEFEDERRYNSADWEYFDLVSNSTFPGLQPAADFIQQAYISEGEESPARHAMAHLLFLTGAEALLDARVARRLCEIGVNAPVYGNEFLRRPFEYMVFDPDGTVRVNYCELVLANRVTARWWPQWSRSRWPGGGH